MAEHVPVPALILAAGAAARYRAAGGSGPKVLALLAGRPLIAHVADVAAAAGLSPTVAVIAAELVTAELGRYGARLVVNSNPNSGIGSSLRVGLAALDKDYAPSAEACVVMLADQPGVDADVVSDVVAAWRRTGRAARARYDDGVGHPVVLPRALWSTLRCSDLTAGDVGARDLLAELGVIEVDIGGCAPTDVDTPSDLVRIDEAKRGDGE